MSLVETGRLVRDTLFTSRTLRDKQPFEDTFDAGMVPHLLKSKKTRLFTAISLNEGTKVPQNERIGYFYLTKLVVAADDVIDSQHQFFTPQSPHAFKAELLDQPFRDTGLTIGEFKDKTLDHFTKPKQAVIETFLDSMITLHSERTPQKPGDYSYTDALQYRKDTNDAWVETISAILDITDPIKIAYYQNMGLQAQYVDDALDCVADINDGLENLWVGLATDIAKEHPEELQRLQSYASLPEDQRPQISWRKWAKKNMPQTRTQYKKNYAALLQESHGLTKKMFWGVGKIL